MTEQNASTPPKQRLVSLPQGAAYLGLSLWSVREHVWHGRIPCVRIGRRVLLDLRDLDEVIEQSKTRAAR